MKSVLGGLLVQETDNALLDGELKVVTKRAPTEKEMSDLLFTWKVVKHIKSNGIAIGKDNCSLGIGPGQVNRIWATVSALERSGEAVRGAVLASDAFFPLQRLCGRGGQGGHHGDHPARRLDSGSGVHRPCG